jgi:glycosyltransferase involved in cell wall biosynthesis
VKILIISWHFPPTNAIAAIRLGKFAAYLSGVGHDVRVLTVEPSAADRSLAVEVDETHIERTPASRRPDPPPRRRLSANATVPAVVSPAPRRPAWRRRLAQLYADIVQFPDKQVGWLPVMTASLRRLCATWWPDLLYVSGPPFSPFIGVGRVARAAGIPWVAEFRDRWADDRYLVGAPWRRRIDGWLERWTMRGVAAIVTVSEPWSRAFAAKFDVPVATVMNGYDPSEWNDLAAATAPTGLPLRLIHAGTVYRERRDPGALFAAIRRGGFAPDELQLRFYGNHLDYLAEQVARYDVGDFVQMRAAVPHREALRLQRESDVLLLMQWNDPADNGNVPGKVFEYLAARRPILGLGPLAGIPARLVREREAGLFANDPEEIVQQLRLWIEHKRRFGQIADLPQSVCAGLARDDQLAILEPFLCRVRAAFD